MCAAIGAPRKTSHSLRVTTVTKLFNAQVEEKLIRSRSGHTSNALFAYEKSSKEQEQNVSEILGPVKPSKQDFIESKPKPSASSSSTEQELPVFEIDELDSFFDEILGEDESLSMSNNVAPPQPPGWKYASDGPINISGNNCNVTINQIRKP